MQLGCNGTLPRYSRRAAQQLDDFLSIIKPSAFRYFFLSAHHFAESLIGRCAKLPATAPHHSIHYESLHDLPLPFISFISFPLQAIFASQSTPPLPPPIYGWPIA